MINIIPCFQFLTCLLLLATALVTSREMGNGTVTAKYCWFFGLMTVAALAALLNHKVRRGHREYQYFVIIFLWLVGLIVTYAHFREITVKWMVVLLLLPLYTFFRQCIAAKHRNMPILLFFLMLTSAIEAVWGLAQLYGFLPSQHSLFKLTGSFYNPGPYAGFLAVCAPVACYYLLADYPIFRRKRRLCRWPLYLRWLAAAFNLVALLLVLPAAMSRAAWLAVVAGCAVAIAAFYRKQLKRLRLPWRKFAFITIPVLLLAFAGMYQLKKDSADGRMLIWKISARVIVNHPLGVGVGGFSAAYGDEQAAYFASGHGTPQEERVAGSPEYAFNEYLQFCIEWGLVPFLLFAWVLLGALWRLFRRGSPVAGVLAALMVFAGMSYPLNLLPFVVVLVFLLAAAGQTGKGEKVDKMNEVEIGRKSVQIRVIRVPKIFRLYIILMSSLCLFALINRYPSYKAYRDWPAVRWLAMLDEYQALYHALRDQIAFLFDYAAVLNKQKRYAESNSIIRQAQKISCDPMLYNLEGNNHQALHNYSAAEAAYRHAADLVPHRLYPCYLLAKFYHEIGNDEKACAMAEIVLTKQPKVSSQAVDEMREEVKKICKENNNTK